MSWSSKRWGIERACTCTSRWYECAQGFHVVDTLDCREVAEREAAELQAEVGVVYRVRDQHMTLGQMAAENGAGQ